MGNYLGAIRNWREICHTESPSSKYIFGIADLHAITVPQNPQTLKQGRYDIIASIIAAGVDPEKCILYHQSSVAEHTELAWILTCMTGMGYLNRMTQWKLKSQVGESGSIFDEDVLSKTKAGLFCYPVLQAADILLYKSTHVPVGDDQAQHLELTRHIASTFNSQTKTKFFPVPKTLLTPTKKINSLRNPTKKMSKSDPDQNACIYINELAEVTRKKLRKAVTDSIQGPVTYDPENRPGVSNLVSIVSGLQGILIENAIEVLSGVETHKQLKDYVADLIEEEFKDTRKLYDELMADQGYLEEICNRGRDQAKEIACENLKQVKKIMGLD